jgi:SP family general alpha glucoside:H+ symporter-like MFS transporter
MSEKNDVEDMRKVSTQHDKADEVADAIAVEHTLTFWEACRLYPKAVGWSMYFSLGVIMLCKSTDVLSYAQWLIV